MNVLILPHTGKVKMRGESNFLLYEDMAKYFLGKGDFVFFCVPDWADEVDLRYQHENLFYVKLQYTKYFYTDMYLFSQDLFLKFNRRVGGGMIDIVITSKLFVTTFFVSGMDGKTNTEVPVIYYEPGIMDKRERLFCRNRFNANSILITMSYLSCYCVFLTENEYKIAKEILKKVVSGIAMKRFCERSKIITIGIPKLEKHKKNELFTVFYGARANKVKNIKGIIKLYNKFYSSGRKIKIIVCTPTDQTLSERYIGKDSISENHEMKLYTDMNREEYISLAKGGHVFVAMSKNESFPVGFWEQMRMGLVGIFPKKKWAISMLPKNYPFMFSNEQEAFTMLTYAYDHYEKAVKMMEDAGIKDMIEEYSVGNVYKNMRGHALKLNEEYREKTRLQKSYKGLLEIFHIALKLMPDEFTLTQFLKVMSKHSNSMPASVAGRTYYRYPTNYNIFVELEYNACKLIKISEVENDYEYHFKRIKN